MEKTYKILKMVLLVLLFAALLLGATGLLGRFLTVLN